MKPSLSQPPPPFRSPESSELWSILSSIIYPLQSRPRSSSHDELPGAAPLGPGGPGGVRRGKRGADELAKLASQSSPAATRSDRTTTWEQVGWLASCPVGQLALLLARRESSGSALCSQQEARKLESSQPTSEQATGRFSATFGREGNERIG